MIGKNKNRNNGHSLAKIEGCLVIFVVWTMLLFLSRSGVITEWFFFFLIFTVTVALADVGVCGTGYVQQKTRPQV